MRRYKFIILILILIISLLFSSCSSSRTKEYESHYFLPTPQNLHNTMLGRIDLSYEDLGLTNTEQQALEKYRAYGNVLRAGTFEWASKAETLTYENVHYDLGVSIFEIEAISKIFNINIYTEKLPLSSCMSKIESGQLDFVINTYNTQNTVSNATYMQSNITSDFLFAYSLEPMSLVQINDLDSLKIGVLKDMNPINADMQHVLADNEISYELNDSYITENQALRALKNEEIDILIQTFSTNLIQKGCSFQNISQMFPDRLCKIAFTTHNADVNLLMSAINKLYNYGTYMHDLKRDYMDLYSTMLVKGGSLFNEAELSLIRSTADTPIKIASQGNSLPYVFMDRQTGKWQGLTYEIWDRVAGISGINYEMVNLGSKSWEEVLNNLGYKNNEITIDAIMPLNPSPDTERYFNLPTSIVTDKYVVVGLHKNQDIYSIFELSDKRVGVVNGYSTTEALKSYLPNETFMNNFYSTDQLVEGLQANEIDYIILTEVEFNEYYYSQQLFDLAIKYEMSPSYSTIAFAGDEKGQMLASIFNKVYDYSRPEEIKLQYLSYNTNIREILNSQNRELVAVMFIAFILIIVLFVFFILRIRAANQKVREIAFVDSITGLFNRTAFYNDNTHASSSLLYVDIDNFKRINELYGHEIGDKFAFETGQRIKALINEQGFEIYTMDIDSYIIVGDDSNSEDKVVSIAAKILYEISKGVEIYDIEHKTTASIGIAFKRSEQGMEELFKKADTALFIAKESGKNRYVIATEEEVAKHNKKQYLQDKLTNKNIQNSIEPYFQPKVDIRDGRIIGVEAFARWNNKDQGMIYPAEFLPILTKNRSISILDVSILAKSCVAYMEWRVKEIIDFNFIISINISDITVADTDIVAIVTKLNKEIGMPFRSLELEITESSFITNYTDIAHKLMELARLGVNISIDNFSASQTIMTRIAQLPVNIVKVSNKVFEHGVTRKTREQFQLISTLSKNLNLGVIVTGVETQEQIQMLKEIPIYRVQGYYYCEAIEKKAIEEELRVKYIYRKS